ncbi:hypothetical protein BDP27DRAFT_1311680 [Rhodocollybia butyracea]|uniref:TPX2 C-terminal domain-containing protein n=1 Tax=Rhodocollybia butyracea TaxID=206335 RepID=A0A9P5Q3M5_9AGAR|nr:hypothetical protein BDP27DRAFT_1311680 [Rhodocollybia butyracea]
MHSTNDLSLRHLPDISNSSFSFEIPAETNDDFLLNHNGDDFFDVVDDSLATPASNRTIFRPLITNQCTPKQSITTVQRGYPETLNRTSPEKPASFVLSNSSQSNSIAPQVNDSEEAWGMGTKKKDRGIIDLRNEVMSTPQRMQRLRDEIKGLADSKRAASPPVAIYDSLNHSLAKSTSEWQTVNSPRFTASRKVPTACSPAACVGNQDIPTTGASDNENVDMSVISSTNGTLAERLVMYSQNLAGSHQLSYLPGGVALGSLTTSSSDSDLTFSQLSPSKPSPTADPTPLSNAPASPVRSSRKRVGSPVLNNQPTKKEKITVKASCANVPGIRTIKKKRTVSANLTSASDRVKTNPLRHASGPSRPRPTRAPLLMSGGSSGRSAVPISREENSTRGSSSGSLSKSTSISKLKERSEAVTQTSATHSTRPVGFNFHSTRRLEARKADSSAREHEHEEEPKRKQKLHTAYTVPDFKASHAAQDALLSSLRGQIKPVAPLPMEFHTDARARERIKYNERVREKELEMERALEEKKRQQAEEVERELRELRKKAIPKAHAVPDWYKDAPRRN